MGLSYSRVCRNKFCDTSSSQASSAELVFNSVGLPLREGKAAPMHRGATSLARNFFRPLRGPGTVVGADFPTAREAVKKSLTDTTISRKGAEPQRLA